MDSMLQSSLGSVVLFGMILAVIVFKAVVEHAADHSLWFRRVGGAMMVIVFVIGAIAAVVVWL